jgi:hypothetical protein
MKTQKKPISRRRKYFVVEDDFIYIVYDNYFESLSEKDCFSLLSEVLNELNACMVREFDMGIPSFIGTMKITTGLKRSAEIFEKKHPGMTSKILATNMFKVS